jgi:DNA-binding response OmpR family regulator
MQVNLTDNEILVLLKLRKMIRTSPTTPSIFMTFIYERMRKVHGENELYDYMHKLAEWRDLISEIEALLRSSM